MGHFFHGFNWLFEQATHAYGRSVGWCLRLSVIVLLVYVGLLGLTGLASLASPPASSPAQDKGYLVVNVQLPDSASLERTLAVIDDGRTDRPGDARRGTTRLPSQGSRSC